MYARSFGLQTGPFNMTPDPAFLYVTPQYREALVGLAYAVLGRKGFVVLTGEAGTGKTTLLVKVLKSVPVSQLQFSVIVNPTLTPSEFLEMVLLDFGVKDIPASKAQRLWKLQNLLFSGRDEGKVSALIVDEAHKLSLEVLEEIRLLGNFEETQRKLLQIVLVGQDELDEILNREDLRQLKQRIALRMCLHPLNPVEVGQYVQHRWTIAGGDQAPFSLDALRGVASASRGIPRIINSVCENALLSAFAEGSATVETRHVDEAAADLQLALMPHHKLAGLEFPAPTPQDLGWVDEVLADVMAHIVEDGSPGPAARRVRVVVDPATANGSHGGDRVTIPGKDGGSEGARVDHPGAPHMTTSVATPDLPPDDRSMVPGALLDEAASSKAGNTAVSSPGLTTKDETGLENRKAVPTERRNGDSDDEPELRTLGFFTLARYQRASRRAFSRGKS